MIILDLWSFIKINSDTWYSVLYAHVWIEKYLYLKEKHDSVSHA